MGPQIEPVRTYRRLAIHSCGATENCKARSGVRPGGARHRQGKQDKTRSRPYVYAHDRNAPVRNRRAPPRAKTLGGASAAATAFDGAFFFAVSTTGVYCRPSCASRPAKRENVSFFATAEAAERAGYRACKRCRPDKLGAPDPQVEAVRRACERIASAEEAPSLADLAASAGLSPFHFHRVFKKVTGVTPKAYAAAEQARRAADGLRTAETVTEAIYDAGFNSSSRFYETATARLGMTPTAVRRGGAGRVIRFAVGEASLGAVLVAATDKGVCAIMLGDDPDALVRDLQDRFPRAELVGGDAEFERTVAEVVGLVEAPGQRLDLPLDIRGTAFQQQVWEALRAIPPAGPRPTPRSRERSAGRRPCARSPRPAPPTRSRSRSPAIASCGRTAIFPATAGASSASASSSRGRRRDEGRLAASPHPARWRGATLLPVGEGERRRDPLPGEGDRG